MINETAENLLNEVKETLKQRGKTYQTENEFSYLEDTALLEGVSTETIIHTMMAIKLSRIKVGLKQGNSVTDSLIDLIGYAVILQAYLNKVEKPKPLATKILPSGCNLGRFTEEVNDQFYILPGSNKQEIVCKRCGTTFENQITFEIHLCPKIWKPL